MTECSTIDERACDYTLIRAHFIGPFIECRVKFLSCEKVITNFVLCVCLSVSALQFCIQITFRANYKFDGDFFLSFFFGWRVGGGSNFNSCLIHLIYNFWECFSSIFFNECLRLGIAKIRKKFLCQIARPNLSHSNISKCSCGCRNICWK